MDLLSETLTVEIDGDTFEFEIPGYAAEIKIGIRERDIRRIYDPQSGGSASGLDFESGFLIRTAAIFETLLRKASVEWVFSAGADGKPAVDHTKWPKDKVILATKVGGEFQEKLTRFRSGGSADGNAARPEAVEMQQGS